MKTKEEILEELFYKPETQDWYKPVLKAMETYAQQLRQPLVIGSVCDGCGSKFDAMDISVGFCYCCQKEIKQTDPECEHPYAFIIGDGEMSPAKCLKCGKVLSA